MLKFTLALISILVVQTTHAQTFKVIKIQGKKAIVEMNDPKLIKVNETYSVGGSDTGLSSTKPSPGAFKRDNAIAFNFGLTSQSSPSVSIINLSGNYLWNMKMYEFGPLIGITNTSAGGTSTSLTTLGGVGYYNFNENKPGVETVMSAVGELSIRSGSGTSVTNIEVGGNYRWFLLSGDHCFSASALYQMAQSSGANTSGFALEAGIMTYF